MVVCGLCSYFYIRYYFSYTSFCYSSFRYTSSCMLPEHGRCKICAPLHLHHLEPQKLALNIILFDERWTMIYLFFYLYCEESEVQLFYPLNPEVLSPSNKYLKFWFYMDFTWDLPCFDNLLFEDLLLFFQYSSYLKQEVKNQANIIKIYILSLCWNPPFNVSDDLRTGEKRPLNVDAILSKLVDET